MGIALLLFEDLPMAILNGILLSKELQKSPLNQAGSCDCDADLSVEGEEEDSNAIFMIIVLGSFTLSVSLMSSKLVRIAAIPKKKKMAEYLHGLSFELLERVDDSAPPAPKKG